jgi:hypothetical protein
LPIKADIPEKLHSGPLQQLPVLLLFGLCSSLRCCCWWAPAAASGTAADGPLQQLLVLLLILVLATAAAALLTAAVAASFAEVAFVRNKRYKLTAVC